MTQRAKLPKLNLRADPAAPSEKDLYQKTAEKERPDRDGKKIIAGHFPKATWAELRRLAVDQEKTAQELLEEALVDLFAKHRR